MLEEKKQSENSHFKKGKEMKMTKVVVLVLAGFLLVNCGGGSSDNNSDTTETTETNNTTTGVDTQKFNEGKDFYILRCSDCHGLEGDSRNQGASVTDIQGALASVEAMQSLSTVVNDTDIEKISYYLQNVK